MLQAGLEWKMMQNKGGRQKLEGQNSQQQAKHATLYSDPV